MSLSNPEATPAGGRPDESVEEQPSRSFPWANPVTRRNFFKLSGASAALAGLSACIRKPVETIVPYVRRPEDVIPGKPLFYATAMTLGGAAAGLLVESHQGRPTKVEGNPDHPGSLGATDPFAQAAPQILYDADRAKSVKNDGQVRTWEDFVAAIRPAIEAQRGRQGAGLRILTESVISPTLGSQVSQILTDFPQARWYQYDSGGLGDSARIAARQAFGRPAAVRYNFENADIVLALDSDFLMARPSTLRYMREFSRRRQVDHGQLTNMNRLYAVESMPTPTGMTADHRIQLRAREVEAFARDLANRLGANAGQVAQGAHNVPANVLDAIARDLQARRGRSIVIPGDYQTSAVHVLAHALNQQLGNIGQTVIVTDPLEVTANPDQPTGLEGLRELVGDMNAGRVELLLILGGNPVYSVPADLQFGDALQRVALRIYHGYYEDETAALSQWLLPETHFLEAWSDTRAFDGTVTIVQPLIQPLYDGRSAHEVIETVFAPGGQTRTGFQIVQSYWQGQNVFGGDFERGWQRALNDGIVPNTALSPLQVSLSPDWATAAASAAQPGQADQTIEICFRPDPTVWDGRFANSGWLQELPKPFTQLTWDNAVHISPATARRLGLNSEDLVELNYQGRRVTGAVWVTPGHADNSATVHLGYGRMRGGRFLVDSSTTDQGGGFNVNLIRTSAAPWQDLGLELRRTGGSYRLATTQEHHKLEQGDPVRMGTLAQFQQDPASVAAGHLEAGAGGEHGGQSPSIYPPYDYSKGYAWGMTVNLGNCTGCNACVIACQAENNIATVTKPNVLRARNMHWLRIDTYYEGLGHDEAERNATIDSNPVVLLQPMYCQHCETAPCEVVCPFTATAHSSEGLNDMVYNRCAGTRYCSQNCPYKVRRFNYLEYNDYDPPAVLKLLPNPD
ncbi:MAG TPA: 4Fe-4S dicluster domain-containing protein, partial [Dehalococcoidia bacterium]|nr:4Fe-4S dicluster domain-containing protein [Dehalococcoidia bacterium]